MIKANIGRMVEYIVSQGRPCTCPELKDFINGSTSYGTTSSEVKSVLKDYPMFFRKVGITRTAGPTGNYEVERWETVTTDVDSLKKLLKCPLKDLKKSVNLGGLVSPQVKKAFLDIK